MAHFAALEESIGRSLKSAWQSILTGLAHFLDARKVLPGSISKESRRGLDWLNFFLADIQTGFGTFVAFYLADRFLSAGRRSDS
jgi:isocitrate lyase